MKAYRVTDKYGTCECSTIIFAKTREQARAIAMCSETFEWYDYGYIDFWVRRIPDLDKYYRGVSEMDWDNPNDRVAMVKEANFYCSDEYELADCECESCPAKEWCERQ